MNKKINLWGTLLSADSEKEFLESKWQDNKSYIFLTYFLCCFFFILAGVFGDFSRQFYSGSAAELMLFRVLLFGVSVIFFILYRKSIVRPRYLEYWLDSMKYLSTIIIILLTYWTKGASLTLLPGIMMMVIGFYMILPGRIFSTNLCAIALLMTFTFLQNPVQTYGFKVHQYMSFMLFAIEILLCTFKIKHDRWARKEYLSKNELDLLNRTKDKLIATIGHDIRSPLAIILSRAELSNMCLKDGALEEVQKSQDVIIKSVSKLDRLLCDIVNWALSDLKQGKDLRQMDCIKKTMDSAIEFVLDQAREKKIHIEKNIEPYPYLHESRMLTTCFRNIISNAIKFNPYNSKVTVTGKVLGDKYIIEFCDQGPGMSEDLIVSIKKGMNTSSGIGTEGERGTGLGLKLVRNVIDTHKGEFDITSNNQGGTIFRLLLPLENGGAIA